MKTKLLGLTVVWMVVLLASPARASEKDAKNFQSKLDTFSLLLADLQSADSTGELARDIEVIRTHIGKGQALIVAEKFDKIENVVARIATQAGHVRSRLDRLEADRLAAAAEKQAQEAEAAQDKVKQEVETAKEKYKTLESQGL